MATSSSSTTTTAAPSPSTWQYVPSYGLFWNPVRQLWAQYDGATGEYRYLPAAATASDTPAGSAADAGELEEGELVDDTPCSATDGRQGLAEEQREDYNDPALYAFPSSSEDPALGTSSSAYRPPAAASTGKQEILRLLCLSSTCLPKEQRLATLSSLQPDGYSLGRDRQVGAEEGRIRLREMEVSKTHAVIYYEPPSEPSAAEDATADDGGWGAAYVDLDDPSLPAERAAPAQAAVEEPVVGRWAIVDLGSTHGTFLKRGGKGKSERLSEAKVASLPADLSHGDIVRVGGTSFQVHLHPGLPCDECSLSLAASLIPTSLPPDCPPSPSSRGSDLPTVDPFAGLNSRERLLKLKHDMLKPSSSSMSSRKRGAGEMQDAQPPLAEDENDAEETANKRAPYIDRAAARRAIHPSFPTLASPSPSSTSVVAAAQPRPPHPGHTTSTPLPSTNVGHALLLKHGWTPGQALGSSVDEGRVDPVQVKRTAAEGRRGLGMKPTAPIVAADNGTEPVSWRDEGREKRWREMGLLK